jgi:hypothetical protein
MSWPIAAGPGGAYGTPAWTVFPANTTVMGAAVKSFLNHSLTPNSEASDRWRNSPPHNPAWKAPRSNHPGGVNVMVCDRHVQFVKDSVYATSWRAPSTRKSGEVVSADNF